MRGINHREDFGWAAALRFGGTPSGNTTTTSTQSSQPWSAEQLPLEEIYEQAGDLVNTPQGTPQYYQGDTYAPITSEQGALMNNLIGATQGGGDAALTGANSYLSNVEGGANTSATSGAFGGANNVLNNELSSSYLNPANSPTYQTAMSNALATALPAANASFVNGNRSDSGLAQAASTSAATNAAAGLAQQQYDTDQGIQNSAAQQASTNQMTAQQQQLQGAFYAPMVDSQQTNDIGTALNTAGMAQTNNQNQINANVASWNYNQMLPWNELGIYENAVTGTGNPGSSLTSTNSEPYFENTGANVLSGISGLGSLALMAAHL